MGSWTSGNHSRDRRPTTKELPSIHVHDIADLPQLTERWVSPPIYHIPNLRVRGSDSRVVFGVRAGNNVVEIGAAGLTYSTRHLGGQQAYFQCQCGKQVTSFYIDGYRVACRHCHRLLYESQFNHKYQQPATKAAKLRAKIGGDPGLLKPLPEKPKHMHQETYERISYQILAHELAAVNGLKRYNEERWLPILLKLDELTANQ